MDRTNHDARHLYAPPWCLEIKAKCCSVLGRHQQAREVLKSMLLELSALCYRSGTTALEINLPEKASRTFQDALSLNPYEWVAFKGLCRFTD
ncbi:hypothetical protein HYPSUDRAFT_150840 [Hypholoma sublateritium FD-334 SS-4]|uniref:Uncharacterized protein n=1 Tax=Hypholoma sublateritium (strain FD-334 SS-4) TaxID=945553 RepID=A0A0D2NBX8_HYPSF|nr:hypothetical protein HYPSUDRAFT_150840 [Hypholoma sublateritium FD-334 SS-4]